MKRIPQPLNIFIKYRPLFIKLILSYRLLLIANPQRFFNNDRFFYKTLLLLVATVGVPHVAVSILKCRSVLFHAIDL